MEFNQESASTLFHYCNELADALRGVLNTQQYNSVDQIFWRQKLNELKKIINGILKYDENKEFYELYKKSNQVFTTRDEIFCLTLKSLIKLQPELHLDDVIQISIDTSKDAIQKLYGVEL